MGSKKVIRTDKEAVGIVRSFAFGKVIESNEEYDILKPYGSAGFVRFGLSFKKKESQASLTKKGLGMMGFCDDCDEAKRELRNSRACRDCKSKKNYLV